jgi:hypothetical protein
VLSPEDEGILADKKAGKELRAEAEAKKLEAIELSFDNGRTFFKAGEGKGEESDWRYRLETGEMAEGLHYLIVRATMANGEAAVTRTLIQVDKSAPWIRVVGPEAGGRYNQSLEYTAFAGDDVELKGLTYHLRKGDKAFYGVPGFMQGLYLDGHFWGATLFDVGLGLTFFDDNVKLQVAYGQFTQKQYNAFTPGPMRYGGHVLGLKLLANIYTLPFGSFAGPDWEWLSASLAIGANFSFFSETQSGSPTWMSAIVAQLEFPKMTVQKKSWTVFRTYSLYTEFQLWFVPTDADAEAMEIPTVMPKITGGIRINLF